MLFYSRIATCLAVVMVLHFSSGCSVTHPRKVENFQQRAKEVKKVLFLVPDMDVRLKYIRTEKYISQKAKREQSYTYYFTGAKQSMDAAGYQFYAEHEQYPKLMKTPTMKTLKNELKKLGDEIVEKDPEYTGEILKGDHVKKVGVPIPKHFRDYDVVVYCYGQVNLETDEEYWNRWTRNVMFNLALLPVAALNFLPNPFTLPITVSLSSFTFKISPDTCFITMVAWDLKSNTITFQNDYYIQDWAFGKAEFVGISKDLLDDFVPEK